MLGGTSAENKVQSSDAAWSVPSNRRGTEIQFFSDRLTPEPPPQPTPPLADYQQIALSLNDSNQLLLGRKFQTALDDTSAVTRNRNVSRSHATITRDATGKYFIEDNRSSLGSYLLRKGESEFQALSPGLHPISKDDVILLGGTGAKDALVEHNEFISNPANRKGTRIIIDDLNDAAAGAQHQAELIARKPNNVERAR
jgi:predicted component of type VI protein secretion system